MITRHDLDAAIAECVGERDPNASTCIKLAAFYTIRRELYPEADQRREADESGYSYAAPPRVETPIAHINSESEFAQTAEGLPLDDVWGIVDELMEATAVANPPLYRAVLRRLDELR